MVTRDPEWDDDDREAAYADWQIDQDTCPICHGPRTECENPDLDRYPGTYTCWKEAAQKVAARTWAEHWEKAKPDASGYVPTDGAHVLVHAIDPTPGLSWPSGLPETPEP